MWFGQVIFGHDARRGLQREPFAIGLDTGLATYTRSNHWMMTATVPPVCYILLAIHVATCTDLSTYSTQFTAWIQVRPEE